MLYGPAGPLTFEMTRAQFEEAISSQLLRTEMLIEMALEEANLQPSDIDTVLLVDVVVLVVTGVLVNDGASLTSATVIVKDCSSKSPPSLTRIVTGLAPTSAFPGVPDSRAVPSPLSVSVSHDGSVGAV